MATIAGNPRVALSKAISLVYDAIAAVREALLDNPGAEEERLLRFRLAQLELLLTHLTEDMRAHIAGSRPWPGPTPAQARNMEGLIQNASQLTQQALTQQAAIAFSARVLELASEVAELA
jgi:hypothetical protein